MKLITTLHLILAHLGKALILCPLMILIVISAESLQHFVEWQLGMYQSQSAFQAKQSNGTRLSFGILKAISVVMACYFVPKKLSSEFGPPPKFGTFNKDIIRKLWDPRGGLHGMIAMFICAVPLVLMHYNLSEYSIGQPMAPLLLFLDGVLIGLLALVMGTAVWAGDAADAIKPT